MKRLNYYVSGLLFLVITLFSCQKEELNKKSSNSEDLSLQKILPGELKANTFYGPQVQVGYGKVRTFFSVNHSGIPQEIGVEISREALSGLPTVLLTNQLKLHPKAAELTPFDHVVFSYIPEIDPPFFLPSAHFNIFFYLLDRLPQEQISAYLYPGPPDNSPTGGATTDAELLPGQDSRPPAYRPYARLMIFGSYTGGLVYIEPIVTLQYLLSGGSVSGAYPQPQSFAKAGYYPTVHNIYSDPKSGTYYVSLSKFVWRNAN